MRRDAPEVWYCGECDLTMPVTERDREIAKEKKGLTFFCPVCAQEMWKTYDVFRNLGDA